jgi:hypothetical protein
MWNRNFIGIIVVIFLLFVDLLIYKYRNANSSKGMMISCYPTGKAYSRKDVSERIRYDSALRSGSSFKLADQNGNIIRNSLK